MVVLALSVMALEHDHLDDLSITDHTLNKQKECKRDLNTDKTTSVLIQIGRSLRH